MIDVLIPLIAGILLLVKPGLFLKQNLDEEVIARKTAVFKKIGWGLLCVSLLAFIGRILINASGMAYQWREFSSVEGNFTVMVPGNMTTQQRLVDTEVGKVEGHIFLCMKGRNVAYTVIYCDYPVSHDISPEKFYEGMGDQFAKQIHGEKISEETVYLGQIPGKEFRLKSAESNIALRLFLVKHRFYQLVVGSTNNSSVSGDDIRKFFSSFKLRDVP